MKRILFAAAASALVLTSLSGTASAHPAYKDSDPKADSTVATPPTELWVEFTESIEEGYVHVYDPCGERADHGEPERNLTNDRITVGTHGDKAGVYRVHWEVLGSDSHITRGEFTFTSSGGAECPREEEETEDPKEPRPPREDRDEDDRATTDDNDQESREDSDDESSRSTRDRSERTRERHENHRNTKDDSVAGKRVLAQDETPSTKETSAPGIWDGIPISDFLVALGVAALIGAAGGRIYAGILGPRR